ncbi:MAG: hypothetical protein KatS3mg008_0980 [Acidimicrobiales bacterium]|nr:MAG: hypothetical protein KatS3mg008_0980 [Acidimicrobiales bacterium]
MTHSGSPAPETDDRHTVRTGPIRTELRARSERSTLSMASAAFFLCFVNWFAFAPFAPQIADSLGLGKRDLVALGLCNVALTIPARVLVGVLLDRWGPRRVYTAILLWACVPAFATALADDYTSLATARVGASLVGASFVVGIRLVREWFPDERLGMAEGIYAGVGNAGSAGAAMALPVIAHLVASAGVGDHSQAWRIAVASPGVASALFALAWWKTVADSPSQGPVAGRMHERARRAPGDRGGAPPPLSRSAGETKLAAVLHAGMPAAVGLIVLRLRDFGVVDSAASLALLAGLAIWAAGEVTRQLRSPCETMVVTEHREPASRSELAHTALLSAAYAATFGGEIALVSLLPTILTERWGLSAVAAGASASLFAWMNVLARPLGGRRADRSDSRIGTIGYYCLRAGLTLLCVAVSAGAGADWVVFALGCAVASWFLQGAEGAIFAVVPLVRRDVAGRVAGIVGAYGNVGATLFLAATWFVGYTALVPLVGLANCCVWFLLKRPGRD